MYRGVITCVNRDCNNIIFVCSTVCAVEYHVLCTAHSKFSFLLASISNKYSLIVFTNETLSQINFD